MENTKKLSSYENGMIYEGFMLMAFPLNDNMKPGMHCSTMQNLIDVENNASTFISHLGSAFEQLEQIKKHLNRAFDELLKRKMPVMFREDLELMKSLIEFADSSELLMSIVQNGINNLNQQKSSNV